MTKPGSVIAALAIAVGTFSAPPAGSNACQAEEAATRVELTGTVRDAEGQPVSGATVLVWTAGVKKGYSTFCPSCYADCGKKATTDPDGAFAIRRLSGDLRFRLLIVREGFAPTFVSKVDPAEGAVSATLPKRESPQDDKQVVRGRIVDLAGEPVANAVIEPDMVYYLNDDGTMGGRGGAVEGLEPVAISNDQGEFEIAYHKPAVKMSLRVKARGHAPARFDDVATGRERHDLGVGTGATIRGRLLCQGKPVAEAEIGLVSQSRFSEEFVPEERIGTRADGTFEFVNVPAPGTWYVYAKMASVVKIGAAVAIESRSARDNETIDLGDIMLKPGHRLRGQVTLADGKPIPEGMRIMLNAERAWDFQIAELPADGRFEFANIPSDRYSISTMVKGYRRMVVKNPKVGWSSGEGIVNGNLDDFLILLERIDD